ncbi:MAG: DUF4846 domain-containing protein [Chitinophagaceae bacterium]|nr:DUF4846 domain-containing protein [Chitinophagaceae bacterium]
MNRLYFLPIFSLIAACQLDAEHSILPNTPEVAPTTISAIPAPPGYERVAARDSFTIWLRRLPLKNDNRVYLYNGELKENQSAQFAVVDIPVGRKNLQQCADAIIRLRTEYFLHSGKEDKIIFTATDGTALSFPAWRKGTRYRLSGNRLVTYVTQQTTTDKRVDLEKFLEIVFAYCGTISLHKEMRQISIEEMQPGDVLIKGGSPGHAMIIIDMAVNTSGQKLFMLAQGYMPAQDMHVVKNPIDARLCPWYQIDNTGVIDTPEWSFSVKDLRRWR